jgi:putative hemolysin
MEKPLLACDDGRGTGDPGGTGAAEPRYEVALAHTAEEVAETQRLRYRVFGQEMQATVHAPGGLERDHYDPFCHHLYVRDAASGEVVSSTRVLTRHGARRAGGFYSAGEFELGGIGSLGGVVIEIGRTCVHRDHRGGAAIGMLWAGLASFVKLNGVDYLFGCASVPMRDGGVQAAAIMDQVRRRHLSPEPLRVAPRRPLPGVRLETNVRPVMPPLLKAYLRLGAWVCGEPCWDEAFGVADVFVLLDVDRLQTRYVQHFLERAGAAPPRLYAAAS